MTDNKTTESEVTVAKGRRKLLLKISLILAILLIVMIIIFGIQNNKPVTLKFIVWEFETTVILLILYVLLIGGTVVAAATLTMLAKGYRKARSLNKEIKELKDRIMKLDKRDT